MCDRRPGGGVPGGPCLPSPGTTLGHQPWDEVGFFAPSCIAWCPQQQATRVSDYLKVTGRWGPKFKPGNLNTTKAILAGFGGSLNFPLPAAASRPPPSREARAFEIPLAYFRLAAVQPSRGEANPEAEV